MNDKSTNKEETMKKELIDRVWGIVRAAVMDRGTQDEIASMFFSVPPEKYEPETYEGLIRKYYCTQNGGDCKTCSLVNYGRDCHNNTI